MKDLIAYIDEFGDSSLEIGNQGVSNLFIVTAIQIDKNYLDEFELKLSEIKNKYFQTGEMKSKGIGKNHQRRIKLLNEIQALRFSFVTIIVDKKRLIGDGFHYKAPFYKYLNGILYRDITTGPKSIQIYSDRIDRASFTNSLQEYIKANHTSSLFDSNIEFADSKNYLGIQLSDIISGTLAWCHDSSRNSESRRAYFELLKRFAAKVSFWPPEHQFTYKPEDFKQQSEYDISSMSYNLALEFIGKKKSKQPFFNQQVICLRYLLYMFDINKDRYISAKEIMSHFLMSYNIEMTLRHFYSRVIGGLRDNDVIIASGQKGYKIPSSEKDIYDFVEHSSATILPFFQRVKKCRDKILTVTNMSIDIFDDPRYIIYQRVSESLVSSPITIF